MVSAGFNLWEAAGRPITPAQPIAELVAKCKAIWPGAAAEFGFYADASHYEADYPEDHTPYSADGWPLPDPHWVVFATDLMSAAMGGTANTQIVFDHLLASAKDGTAPWIKYLIWDGRIYDVRHGWVPQPADDHYDHIHVSARTDYQHASLGTWSPWPTGSDATTEEDDMTPEQAAQLADIHFTIRRATSSDPANGKKNDQDIRYILWNQQAAVQKQIAGLAAQATGLQAVVQSLADAIKAGGGSVDTAAILAGVNAAVDSHVAGLVDQIDAQTRDAIADAAEGGATAVRADDN